MIKQRPARMGIQDNNTREGKSETDLRTDDCGEATHMSLDHWGRVYCYSSAIYNQFSPRIKHVIPLFCE